MNISYLNNNTEKDNEIFDLIKDLKFNVSEKIFKRTDIIIYGDGINEREKGEKGEKKFTIKLCKNIIDGDYDLIISYNNISNFNLKNLLNEVINKKIKGKIDEKNLNNYIKVKNEKIYEEDKSYVVNIYIPTYYRIEKCKRSLTSIISQSKNSIHDVKIYVYDNNTNIEEMKEFLDSIPVLVTYGKVNIGKANAVNHLHSISRKSDFIFSIDSDMYFDEEEEKKYNIIDKMVLCLIKCKNLGLVSSFQKIQSEHWLNKSVFPKKEGDFNLGLSVNRAGIAGGCVCIKSDDWNKIGGYKKNHDIYTGDDGILMKKVYEILAKRCAISMDYKMSHPSGREDDAGYNEWKKNSWERDKLSFFKDNYKGTNNKGYYD